MTTPHPSDKYFYLAAAIITDASDRLLVVRKQNTHKFMLPGGKIEAGETPREALLRELEEEIALKIEASRPIFIQEYEAPAANEPDYRIKSNLFRVKLDEILTIHPEAEIAEIRWVEKDQTEGIDFAPLIESFVIPLWRSELENPAHGEID